MNDKIIKKYDVKNISSDYTVVAIGSIFCLSALLNNTSIDKALTRAEVLLEIDKEKYYNQFVNTVNLYIKKYINSDGGEV